MDLGGCIFLTVVLERAPNSRPLEQIWKLFRKQKFQAEFGDGKITHSRKHIVKIQTTSSDSRKPVNDYDNDNNGKNDIRQ